MSSALPAQEVPDVRLLDCFDLHLPHLPELPRRPAQDFSKTSADFPLSSRSSAVETGGEAVVPQSSGQTEATPTKPKRSFKRSKTAEEKAARIKARNRRAQQAFRSRQKALNVERAQSLDNLHQEVSYLREVNGQLLGRIEELTDELTDLKITQSQQCMSAELEGMMKQEASDMSEDLQTVCPLVLGMIPNDDLGL